MPKLARNISSEFNIKRIYLETIRAKLETLFIGGHVTSDDLHQLYAGLFLEGFTTFENCIESLFLGLLQGKIFSRARPARRLHTIQPTAKIRDVVFNFKPYVDWLPYEDRTIPLAKNYFHNGEPFSLLSASQVSNLKFYHLIRNAIAHKSLAAQTKFNAVIAGLPLLPHEKTPTGFLRSITSTTLPQTQYEIALNELESVLTTLCM